MVDECVEALQTVEQRQLLQVQVVVLADLLFQILAAKIHHLPHLKESEGFKFVTY